jgi:hypothetical protein
MFIHVAVSWAWPPCLLRYLPWRPRLQLQLRWCACTTFQPAPILPYSPIHPPIQVVVQSSFSAAAPVPTPTVSHLTLSVRAGELVALVGSVGCGKSTVLLAAVRGRGQCIVVCAHLVCVCCLCGRHVVVWAWAVYYCVCKLCVCCLCGRHVEVCGVCVMTPTPTPLLLLSRHRPGRFPRGPMDPWGFEAMWCVGCTPHWFP